MVETTTFENTATAAGPAIELPDDARCATCGYLLRGLQEPRCPECGSAFDPSTIRDTFVPHWPELLSWWVAASVFPVVVVLVLLLPEIFRSYRAFPGETFAIRVYFWCAVANWIGPCVVGPLVLLGLRWRRDWARRLCLAGLLMLALIWVFNLGVQVVSRIRGAWPGGDVLEQAIDGVLANAVPAVLLAVYLMTGLRRRSLRRHAHNPPPWLSFHEFHPRQDWLLLTLILVAAMGLPFAGPLANIAVRFSSVSLMLSVVPTLQLASLVLGAAVVAGCAATMVLTWRRPRTLRRNLAMLIGAVLAARGVQLASFIATASGAWSSWALLVGVCIDFCLAPLIPPLAVLLYVFVRLNKADITQVTYNGRVVGGG